jgi:AraC-like DNA-binding protein
MLSELEFTLPRLANVATYPPGATFGPRRLMDYEFVWMIEGDAVYHCDGQSYDAPQGSVVLCRPNEADSFVWDTRRRTRHGYFHWQITKTPRDWPPPSQWPLVRTPGAGDILQPLFGHILTWCREEREDQLRLSIAYLLSVYVSGETAASNMAHEAWPEPVERVWHLIRKRMAEDTVADIGLEEMARVACVSPEHLCRVFKAATGHSPVETVRLARLDRAAQLLARTNFSIGEIARLCGFASQFHFSRSFRAAYGFPPSEARAQVRSGAATPGTRLASRWQSSDKI